MPTIKINSKNLKYFLISEKFKKQFKQKLKSLINIIPEFTHKPIFHIKENLQLEFQPSFPYKDMYGTTSANINCSWFGLNENKIKGSKFLEFDFESFGFKQASFEKIKSFCAIDDIRELKIKRQEKLKDIDELKRKIAKAEKELNEN